jgi:hypothetical protein
VNLSRELDKLGRIDWKILQARDFSRDNDDLDKTSRYQAEALVHKHMPIDSLLGVACCDEDQRRRVDSLVDQHGVALKVVTQRGWYF